MRILALDLSLESAGFACWGPDDAVPASGAWVLGSEYTSPGCAFARLHERMSEIAALGKVDAVFYERPRHLDGFNKESNQRAHFVLVGLAAHAESWGEAMGCRIIRSAHMSSWRAHFLRGMRRPKNPDGSKIEGILKVMAVERCKAFGLRTSCHDQAEAIGILDYACDSLGFLPPWRRDNALLPALATGS